MNSRRVPDGCVVATDPLRHMLRGFLTDWNRQHPSTTGQFGTSETHVEHVRGIEWLSDESGVPSSTIEHVLAGRYRTTELRVADPLVASMGQPWEIAEGGALEPFPNPNAPRAVRGGDGGNCGCSGSTQLSLTGDGAPLSC